MGVHLGPFVGADDPHSQRGGTLIHVFAIGYMHGDPRFGRFFCYLNLFAASMLTLVLAGNFAVLFLGWELVGSAPPLISFWFVRPAAASAGTKAFVVNRIGDFGFMVALMIVFATFGTLSFGEVLEDPGALLSGGGDRSRAAPLAGRRREVGADTALRLASTPWRAQPRYRR